MVTQAYLLDKPAPPSKPHQLFMQHALPRLVDFAGSMEAVLERVSVGTRRHPARGMALALATGAVVAYLGQRVAARR